MGSSISREDAVVPSVEAIDAQARRRLDALAREHAPFLRGLAGKLCRGTFDPEDLVQDVLMKAVANFDRLPPDVNHAAWMARVMQNLFIDRLRSRASQRPIPIDDVVVAAPPLLRGAGHRPPPRGPRGLPSMPGGRRSGARSSDPPGDRPADRASAGRALG